MCYYRIESSCNYTLDSVSISNVLITLDVSRRIDSTESYKVEAFDCKAFRTIERKTADSKEAALKVFRSYVRKYKNRTLSLSQA